jgi:hypothetical protein
MTYVDWSSIPYPAWINQNHVALFKKQIEFNNSYGTYTPFFARKFDDSRANIVELIEKELRNEQIWRNPVNPGHTDDQKT